MRHGVSPTETEAKDEENYKDSLDQSFGPDESHFELLELIEAAPPGGVEVKELVEKVGIDEGSIFERITTMIMHGAPIAFGCSDSCWQDFYSPEEMFYWIAERPEHLSHDIHMIEEAQKRLSELKQGVERRQVELSAHGQLTLGSES